MFRRSERGKVERQLTNVISELARVRAEAAVLTEQLDALNEDAEEAGVRALVSENTGEIREARHAKGAADRLERALAHSSQRAVALEARRDALLLSLPLD